MNMHFKTTFFLFLALAIAVGVIWILEWGKETDEQPTPAEQKLLSIEPEKISYVSFYWEGQFIECMNEQGQWMIHKPMNTRADAGRIHHILAVIEMLPKGETITAAQRQARGLSLDDYGLATPRARIVVGDAEKRHRLAIGSDSPLKNAVYVQLDHEDSVMATSTNLLDIIPRQVGEIRDARLLQGSAAYVRRLDIKRLNSPLIQLVKEGAEWIQQKPVIARTDWTKVSCLLEQLFGLSIQQFVSETMADPVAYGLGEDEAMLQISLWQEGEKNVEKVLFGQKADTQGHLMYAGRRESSSVYAVSKDRVDALLTTIADLRDPRLYFMAPDKIAFIRIEEGERALQFQKTKDAGWQIVEPKQWKADSRMVADLISRLNTLRVDMGVNSTHLKEMGLDRPAHVIRVAEEGPVSGMATQGVEPTAVSLEKAGRSLLVSPPQPGKEYVFAKFEDDPQIYRISASSSSTISLDPLSYRDSTVLSLDPSAVRKITLKKDGGEQAVERSGSDTWKPVTPPTGNVDKAVVTNILGKVADLKVLRFERSDIKEVAMYDLKEARASLTFSLSGEEGIQKTLLFGEHTEDLGVYAMVQGQEVVFVLEKALVDSMLRALIR